MTTPDTITSTVRNPGRFRLPDPPERNPDEVTQFDHLFKTGNSYHLAQRLGNPETTLVEADRWIVPDQNFNKARARVPDLMVAFDVNAEIYAANNGYVVSEQGKPPDFVMEVASPSTADNDLGPKRAFYADLGILEYWRFDKTGEHHGTRLAGERLVDGVYVDIPIVELPGGSLQGYSAALGLHLRWTNGELEFCDPTTGGPIATMVTEQEARAAAQAQTALERQARTAAQAQAALEREARLAAEARVRELEERLRIQNS